MSAIDVGLGRDTSYVIYLLTPVCDYFLSFLSCCYCRHISFSTYRSPHSSAFLHFATIFSHRPGTLNHIIPIVLHAPFNALHKRAPAHLSSLLTTTWYPHHSRFLPFPEMSLLFSYILCKILPILPSSIQMSALLHTRCPEILCSYNHDVTFYIIVLLRTSVPSDRNQAGVRLKKNNDYFRRGIYHCLMLTENLKIRS